MRRSSIIPFILVAFVLTACGSSGGGGGGGPSTGTITGIVLDTDATLAQGLEVDVNSDAAVTTTDVAGAFSTKVPPGDYTVSVYHVLPNGRYLVAQGTVIGIKADEEVEVTLTLTGDYYIDGDFYFLDVDADDYGDASGAGLCVTTGAGSPGAGYRPSNELTGLDTDCDDANADTYPGATELCDGEDNNCDALTPDDEADADADGWMGCEGDCDDGDDTSYPGGSEVCDGADNDCDGTADDMVRACYDGDPGTRGVGTCADGTQTCTAGVWSACGGQTLPALESCDGLDNDCDAATDEDLTAPLASLQQGVCSGATKVCNGAGGWGEPNYGTYSAVYEATELSCDYLDNDCDGDEDDLLIWNDRDAACTNGDGACQEIGQMVCNSADPTGPTICNAVPGDPGPELCNSIDDDCDGTIDEDFSDKGNACSAGTGICYDTGTMVCSVDQTTTACDAVAGTPVTEACNGLDDDCDGTIDNGNPEGGGSCDTGLLGVCQPGTLTCAEGDLACVQTVASGPEICNGLDDNCNGFSDEGFDGDADGFTSCAGDCDDTDATTYPGAPEVCDGVDNDCDPTTSEDATDGDADGVRVCDGDCDDTNPVSYPGAAELCDGLDNDCDGVTSTDEIDDDFDGFAECSGDCDDTNPIRFPGAAELCNGIDDDCDGSLPASEQDGDADGMSTCAGDCDDTDPTTYAGAPELCDGFDNDCDFATVGENDLDADGVRECAGDCDDFDADRFPGNPEVCDGVDNDCDGIIPTDEVDDDFDAYAECFGDCDDTNSSVNPDAVEQTCDGVDNDCDIITEDAPDGDADGYSLCDDCDDGDPDINPGATEIPDNGIDEDCDGLDGTYEPPAPVAVANPSTTVDTLPGGEFVIYSFPVVNGETYSLVLTFTQATDNPAMGLAETEAAIDDAIVNDNFSGLIDLVDAPAGIAEAVTFTATYTGTYYVGIGAEATLDYTLYITTAQGICDGEMTTAYDAPFDAFEMAWATTEPTDVTEYDASFDRTNYFHNGEDFDTWASTRGVWPTTPDLIGITFEDRTVCQEDTGNAIIITRIMFGSSDVGMEKFYLTEIGGGAWRIVGNQRLVWIGADIFALRRTDYSTGAATSSTLFESGMRFNMEGADTATIGHALFKGPGMPWDGLRIDVDGSGYASGGGIYQESLATMFGATQIGNVPAGTRLRIELYSPTDTLIDTYDEWISAGLKRDPSDADPFPVINAPTPAAMSVYDYTSNSTFAVDWTLVADGSEVCVSLSDSSNYNQSCTEDGLSSPHDFTGMWFNPSELTVEHETVDQGIYTTFILIGP